MAPDLRPVALVTGASNGIGEAFVLNFSEALWAETRTTGVHVVALCPGFTRTAFQRVAENPKEMQKVQMQTAEEVVEECLRALPPRSSHIICGQRNRWMIWSERLALRAFVVRVAADRMRQQG